MKFTYVTCGAEQTRELGKMWGEKALQDKKRIWALEGELGGGKTTFLQGFASGLGISDRILSPTFVLMKKFNLGHPVFNYFYHIDCYRTFKEEEILELGFKKIVSDPTNIVAVEWANRIDNILPPARVNIDFHFYNLKKRSITIYD